MYIILLRIQPPSFYTEKYEVTEAYHSTQVILEI